MVARLKDVPNRLASKLIAITLLISAIGLIAIAVFAVTAGTHTLADSQHNRLLERVDQQARLLQSNMGAAKRDLAVLAEVSAAGVQADLRDVHVDNLQLLADQLGTVMRMNPAYAEVLVVLQDRWGPRAVHGIRLGEKVHTLVDPALADYSHERLLAERQGLRSFENPLGLDRGLFRAAGSALTERRVLYFNAPIQVEEGTVLGGIGLVVDIALLARGVDLPRDDISVALTDGAGKYLFRSHHDTSPGESPKPIQEDIGLGSTWNQWLLGQNPRTDFDLSDRALLMSAQRIELVTPVQDPETQLLVISGIASLRGVAQTAAQLSFRLAFVVLAIGVLTAIVLAWATSHLTRPISMLTRAADRIASGERDTELPAQRNDDIGVLARTMLKMADALRAAGKSAEEIAMGRMATMIAHDLRNALSSIKMNVKILRGHQQDASGEYRNGCEIALQQIRYMEDVLNDMLTFARPESEEMDWVDLGEVLRTAAISLLPRLDEKSVTVSSDQIPPLPKILGNRTKLIQVFQNLLNNAIEASPTNATVTIEAHSLLHDSRPAVEVRITDEGSGVPAEIADKVFEPFFTTRARGTGLGLAIVAKIVKQHSGQVHLESAPQGGCTAVTIFPVSPAA